MDREREQRKMVVLDGAVLNPGDNPWTCVEALGDLKVFDRTHPDDVVARCAGAEVVLTNKTPLTAETLQQLPSLRLICVLATGYDVVDVDAARTLRIPGVNVPEYSSDEVAQHTFALLLSLLHAPREHDQAIRAGEWEERREFAFWHNAPLSLYGRTLGLIGLGHIGQRVAQIGRAFGMSVCAYRRSQRPVEGVEMRPLNEVLQRADILSLHCPLTPQTHHLIHRDTLALCKPSAFLLNTSRGGLVHELDLSQALCEGRLAGYGADVASTEPIHPKNPLLSAPNVLITPHMAWSSIRSRKRLMEVTAENIAEFDRGYVPHCVYPTD